MIFVDNQQVVDPRVNLALEEYLLRNLDIHEDLLLLYINEPSIILGRNQNALEEINLKYVREHGIHVVRRVSGGGTVYHDLGNLNYSFITDYAPENFHNFRKFTKPVIKVLHDLGVQAELNKRNDILVDGRKISGTAQYSTSKRMVSHGTLLFNAQLGDVTEALNVKMSRIVSKGIKSVRSQVANISEYMNEAMTIETFRQHILQGVFEGTNPIPQYHLTDGDWAGVHELVEERYSQWAWNFGRSPQFSVQRMQRFPLGEVNARIFVKNGVIEKVEFLGDFPDMCDLMELETALIGVRYDPAALADIEALEKIKSIPSETFVKFLYG
jgi:lipoate-protein ligase A